MSAIWQRWTWLTLGSLLVAHSCRVDEDCNLNGLCTTSGSCSCLPGWRGPMCGELALISATVGAGLHAAPSSNMSSWGGWVGWDDSTQRWQMFANEMVDGCGINSWEANSRIVRASTSDLQQPFQVEAQVKQPFGSEPTLTRLESGDWLMFSIGNRSSTLPPRTDCIAGYTPGERPPNGTGGNFKGYVPVEVSTQSYVCCAVYTVLYLCTLRSRLCMLPAKCGGCTCAQVLCYRSPSTQI